MKHIEEIYDMILTLEIIPAGHGECFLLHYGSEKKPHLMLVDGGPSGTYLTSLRPRLEALGQRRKRLELELVVVGHSDEDHIAGLVDLTDELLRDRHLEVRVGIKEFWHNSFAALMGETWMNTVFRNAAGSQTWRPEAESQFLVSIPLAERLRQNMIELGVYTNEIFPDGIVSSRPGTGAIKLRGGLRLQVLGPYPQHIEDHRRRVEQWANTKIEPSFIGQTNTYSSVYFLASLQGKTILFTGDARGENILAGLHAHGLLNNGRIHVDVLKVPNHGAGRNIDTSFYKAVTANHYVIGANGRYGNPDLAVIQMILSSRVNEEFDLYFSCSPEEFNGGYPRQALKSLLYEAKRKGARFTVHTPPKNGLPMGIAIVGRCEALTILDQFSPDTLWSPFAGARVFVSYHHGDSTIAASIANSLKLNGFDIWKADEKLKPGTPAWARSVEQALDSSQCVVVILSPGAKQSEWVRRELYYADIRKMPVIPVVVAGSDEEAVPVELSHLQRVIARNQRRRAEAVEEIVHGLEQALSGAPPC